MSTTSSSNLSLPYIQANQAQKHVTHNEGMRILDSLTQLSVISMGDTTPPPSPAPGDRFIVGASATGDWLGQDGALAVWDENAWRFFDVAEGWTIWDQASGSQQVFTASQWAAVVPDLSDLQNLNLLGVNTTADTTNRLALAADATLLTHDTTGGHQLKLNKAAPTDTASLLFQTGYQGRAEMGTTGSDNFEVKVSADGATFHQAMVVDGATGEVSFPNTTPDSFSGGTWNAQTVDYVTAKGDDLVANTTGRLGSNYNMPSSFAFDGSQAPDTYAAFSYTGYYSALHTSGEFIPVDPNQIYKFGCYVMQEALPGDWSAFTHGDRHRQRIGFREYDSDQNLIEGNHHMRFAAGGVDSYTTLTQALTPGDSVVHVADAAGWNDSTTAYYRRGIILYGHKNTLGRQYDHYSRLVEYSLFDPAGVDKVNNTITLNAPFPASLGNPEDSNGTWGIGTALANSNLGGIKYNLLNTSVVGSSQDWYHAQNYVGGVDLSGTNTSFNFSPGTAFVKLCWVPNSTNRVGGVSIYPDTGATHKVWFTGMSIKPEPLGQMQGQSDGSVALKVADVDFASGGVSFIPAAARLDQV